MEDTSDSTLHSFSLRHINTNSALKRRGPSAPWHLLRCWSQRHQRGGAEASPLHGGEGGLVGEQDSMGWMDHVSVSLQRGASAERQVHLGLDVAGTVGSFHVRRVQTSGFSVGELDLAVLGATARARRVAVLLFH